MLTPSQVRQMQERVTQTLAQAGIVLTSQEQTQIEVVDFGLSELERTGLQLVIYINNDRYCAKELVMIPRQTCAQHRHPPLSETNPGKQETFRCRWGKVWLYVEGEAGHDIHAPVPDGSGTYYTDFHQIEMHLFDQDTIPPHSLPLRFLLLFFPFFFFPLALLFFLLFLPPLDLVFLFFVFFFPLPLALFFFLFPPLPLALVLLALVLLPLALLLLALFMPLPSA